MSSTYSHHYHDQRVMMISLPLSPPSHRHDTIMAHHDYNYITTLSLPTPSSTSSSSSYYSVAADQGNSYSMGQPPPPLPIISNRSSSSSHSATLLHSTSPHMQVFSSSPPVMTINDTHGYHQTMHPPSPPPQQTAGRPHLCTICPRAFSRKHDLQRHSRVHTGVKPYTCLCCKKAFARTDALKRHLRMEDDCRLSPEIQALKNAGKRRYRNL